MPTSVRCEQRRCSIGRSIIRCGSEVIAALAAVLLICLGGVMYAEEFPVLEGEQVVGVVRTARVRRGDSLLDIARLCDIGYNQIVAANEGVNRWVPPVGKEVVIPSLYVLPAVPREGIVLNLAELRLYFFPMGRGIVYTYPVSVGDLDWRTPLGMTRVAGKERDPVWTPPPSIRREHAEEGEELPPYVPGGAADNPLGHFALRLGVKGYLIHGTDARKEFGIGMRVTHGCVRMYPEDIEELYGMVQVGTPVRIIDEPVKAGWRGGELYLEVHRPREAEDRDPGTTPTARQVVAALRGVLRPGDEFDDGAVIRVFEEGDGVPHVVGRREMRWEGNLPVLPR